MLTGKVVHSFVGETDLHFRQKVGKIDPRYKKTPNNGTQMNVLHAFAIARCHLMTS